MHRFPLRRLTLLAATALSLSTFAAQAEEQSFMVISGGENVGHVIADVEGDRVAIDYDVKNNGRGPTMRETMVLGDDGLPLSWDLDGTSTFGNAVDENFTRDGRAVRWTDSTGTGSMEADGGPIIYVAQEGSPWSLGLYARALLADADHAIPSAPGGTLSLEEEAPVTLGGTEYRSYLVKGIGMSPSAILLDDDGGLIASYSSGGATIREGLESHVEALSAIAAERSAARFATLQERLAHRFDAPVRLRNVRIFDPASGTLGEPSSLVFFEDRIASVEPLDSPATPGEVLIEGEGRTVIPGLNDMHAHLSMQSALLYIASGVTSVRDMGNDNDVLLDTQRRIEAGDLAGPRIVRNGFLEGRSEYSARHGKIAATQAEALEAVRWYGARGYWQIKIYNSFNPDWVPAVTQEAKRLGMGVTGHVPAFTSADTMIAAGYDEITHINQLMLGWVLEPEEDTRTPLRLTAMRRTAGLDLRSPKVAATLDAMEEHGIAIDPTAVTLELLMLSRDGVISPAVRHYYDHLPVSLQRRRLQGIAPMKGDDLTRYQGAFENIKALLADMHRRGITLLPGTDDGTGLSVHRELQIYGEAGIPAADVLRLGTLGPAQYMGLDESRGSVTKGKFADFALIDGNPLEDLTALHRMAMVVKGGIAYYPAEIWQEMGVKPFAEPPVVNLPKGQADAGHVPAGRVHDHQDAY